MARRCSSRPFAFSFLPALMVAGVAATLLSAERRWDQQAYSSCFTGSAMKARPSMPLAIDKSAVCQSRHLHRHIRASGSTIGLGGPLHAVEALVSFLNANFAAFLAVVSLISLRWPHLLDWVRPEWFTTLLSLLMLSVGVTTSFSDFRASAKKRIAVVINFVSCYGLMPAFAYLVARLIHADQNTLAGLVLIGTINGGHTSNLCTLIARGDVALSVLMTMSTTAGCILMTPAMCKAILGTAVPMDAMGIVYSTLQVVLLPTILGLSLNALFPKFCSRVASITPALGVFATILIVGSSVASCREYILAAGWSLQIGVICLHLFGGAVGYGLARLAGQTKKTCRTVAIETSMKSSAVGYLLATLHFSNFTVRVPAAVSVIWSAVVGGCLAAYWRRYSPE
eukprot:CAMPEP_0178404660 /NCGR_PEP_ID=MMETSP0689_2-20121128/18000_1 /TAXON_ID=160604 /ORGANISM="Amphidinium massartii, Strain CS-259" /LENGTH=396 /DNA_ID=CAMNT_0020025655 /DNA_START=82 /DNA_END=1272 /DNA_ORIENTATION=-